MRKPGLWRRRHRRIRRQSIDHNRREADRRVGRTTVAPRREPDRCMAPAFRSRCGSRCTQGAWCPLREGKQERGWGCEQVLAHGRLRPAASGWPRRGVGGRSGGATVGGRRAAQSDSHQASARQWVPALLVADESGHAARIVASGVNEPRHIAPPPHASSAARAGAPLTCSASKPILSKHTDYCSPRMQTSTPAAPSLSNRTTCATHRAGSRLSSSAPPLRKYRLAPAVTGAPRSR
jgi:hypothetical protein